MEDMKEVKRNIRLVAFIVVLILLCNVFCFPRVIADDKSINQSPTQSPTGPSPTKGQTNGEIRDYLFILAIVAMAMGIILLLYYIYLGRKEKIEALDYKEAPRSFTKLIKIPVIDEQNKQPIRGAKLKLLDFMHNPIQASETDDEGIARFNGVEFRMSYTLTINADGFEPKTIRLEEGKDGLYPPIILKPSIISIKVVNAVDMLSPIVNAKVKLTNERNQVTETLTSSDGLATFIGLRKGIYYAEVTAIGYEKLEERVEIPKKDLILKLNQKKGILNLAVLSESNEKIPNAKVMVIHKATRKPISLITNSDGRISSQVPIGESEIIVESDPNLFEISKEKFIIESEKTNIIEIVLRSKFALNQSQSSEIAEMYSKLSNCYNELSAYDRCIPSFYQAIGKEFLSLIDGIPKNVHWFVNSKSKPDEVVSIFLEITRKVVDEICRIMTSKKNIDLYYVASKLDKCENKKADSLLGAEFKLEFREVVRNPMKYRNAYFNDILNKLTKIDDEITQRSSKMTIDPVADLWGIAKKLLEDTRRTEGGSDLKFSLYLFAIDKILNHTIKMYNDEDILKRLALTTF